MIPEVFIPEGGNALYVFAGEPLSSLLAH